MALSHWFTKIVIKMVLKIRTDYEYRLYVHMYNTGYMLFFEEYYSILYYTSLYFVLFFSEPIYIYRVLEKSRNGRIFHKLCTLERNISDKSCMA